MATKDGDETKDSFCVGFRIKIKIQVHRIKA